MRRIVDQQKMQQTYKTSDALEKAFVEEVKHNYLYADGDAFVFMNPDNYEQITVTADTLGDLAPYLSENMEVDLLMHDGIALSISLPPRVALEIVETRAGGEGPDRLVVLQARQTLQWPKDHGAAAYRCRHARYRVDR